MMPTGTAPEVERFLDLAIEGHRTEAIRFVLDRFDTGTTADRIIRDVLIASQEETGHRWQRGEWTVTDEHLVTGVTQAALDALATVVPDPGGSGQAVVVACAEGEWHSLPAQFLAELLRARGHRTRFLGASAPAEEVAGFLQRHDVSMLAVSCSLPLSYWGVAKVVAAAHAEGVPVIAGGRALTAARAHRLGADAWGADVDALVTRLEGWRTEPPPVLRTAPEVDPGVVRLKTEAAELAAEAHARLLHLLPGTADLDERQQTRTLEDLEYIVRFVAAARLVADQEVLSTFLTWLEDVLGARSVPKGAMVSGLEALLPALDARDPVGSGWVRDELAARSSEPGT